MLAFIRELAVLCAMVLVGTVLAVIVFVSILQPYFGWTWS